MRTKPLRPPRGTSWRGHSNDSGATSLITSLWPGADTFVTSVSRCRPVSDPSSLTLADVLREHRRSRPDALAVVDGDQRSRFPQFDERVNRLANALGAAGVDEGERVLWL